MDAINQNLSALQSTADEVITDMNAAYTAAKDGEKLEQDTFTAAEKMLDYMINFDAKAEGTSRFIDVVDFLPIMTTMFYCHSSKTLLL